MTAASSPPAGTSSADPALDPAAYVAVDGEGNDTLAPRQCGRCRKLFEGDPTLLAGALQEWWACPPCRAALLGR